MKNLANAIIIATAFIFLATPNLINAQTTSVGPFTFLPNNKSASIVAEIKVDQATADPNDVLAVFDENGICAGAVELLLNPEGATFANLPIYADDSFTSDVDDGLNAGEKYSFRLFRSTTNETLIYQEENNTVYFNDWTNLNGDPLPAFKYDQFVVLDFTSPNTGISEIASNASFQVNHVMPIPAVNFIQIDFNSLEYQQIKYEVYNVDGKLILSKKFSTNIGQDILTINTEQLTAGSYFIKLSSNNFDSISLPFLKN